MGRQLRSGRAGGGLVGREFALAAELRNESIRAGELREGESMGPRSLDAHAHVLDS